MQAARIGNPHLFGVLTAALIYEFAVLPSVFLYFVLKARTPPRRIAPKNKKVAVISLCVPSKESLDIIERQLKAMGKIKYPHDNWVLDEGNSKEVKKLAKKYGVNHFSRKGIRKYNRPRPPFQKKTKAGNVNAWLDRVKRRKYEYFVQLDIDHIPKPNYVHKTLGYFRDESVAWVQSPSVYGNRNNWTARGSAEQELVLQGPLQMGFYGHSETPFIIGSHCAYRTSAINEINGFQPTRAEDHLDTVALASKGYKGVFLPEVIAEGDGPETLNTYLSQQFAWAYSMFQVLLHHSPKLLKTMPVRKKIQFLFAQTWYPLWSLAYLTMFMVPAIALVMNKDVALMPRESFVLHFLPLFACTFLVWLSAKPLMQPKGVGLSWRGMILHVVRWPVILRAILSALFRIKKPYMITPKGKYSQIAPSAILYRPFVVFGLISSLSIVYASFAYGNKDMEGQTVFALMNALFMAIICVVDLDLRIREKKKGKLKLDMPWVKPVTAVMSLVVVIASSFILSPIGANKTVDAFTSNLHLETKPANKQIISYENSTVDEIINATKNLPGTPKKRTPAVGIYDPKKRPDESNRYINHMFVNWNDTKNLAYQQYKTFEADNVPLVTVEPRGEADGSLLLSNITRGKHDSKLKNMAEVLGATDREVYIRFAHEMELRDLYPWGNQDSTQFISAYRYVVKYMNKNGAENIKWVWSPAGNPGAEAYYPGEKFVDVVGTTVLYDQYWYGQRILSFNELSQKRVWLTSFNKPVWVVEFGAGRANSKIQNQLIKDALQSYQSIGFGVLLYLNIADSNIEGPDYRTSEFLRFAFAEDKPNKNQAAEKISKPRAGQNRPKACKPPDPLEWLGTRPEQKAQKDLSCFVQLR